MPALPHPLRRVLAPVLLVAAACGEPPVPGGEQEPAPTDSIPGPASDAGAGTAAADSGARAPESVGGLQARHTGVRGVVADLLEVRRDGEALVVTIRFRNTTRDTLDLPAEIAASVADWTLTAGGRAWPLAEAPRGALPARLAPSETRLWRGVFQAPPRDVRAFDLTIPGVDPFTGVPVVQP